jgi:hypothetical protein
MNYLIIPSSEVVDKIKNCRRNRKVPVIYRKYFARLILANKFKLYCFISDIDIVLDMIDDLLSHE